MTTLDTDSVRVEATTEGIIAEPQYLSYLRSQGYPIDSVQSVKIVESSSRDIAHVVMQVQTLAKPPGHQDSDVVADKTKITVCSCEDFRYNKSVDVAEQTLADGSLGACKHIRQSFKAIRAQTDDQQQTF